MNAPSLQPPLQSASTLAEEAALASRVPGNPCGISHYARERHPALRAAANVLSRISERFGLSEGTASSPQMAPGWGRGNKEKGFKDLRIQGSKGKKKG